ncbi:MAG: phosphatase PAP2 family protein [Bacteroidales bacterium]|nr:phosphatase PAP2 family protein [Bacteroidales bacterium]
MTKYIAFVVSLFLILSVEGTSAQNIDARMLHAINQNTTPFWNSYSSVMSTSVPYVSAGLPVVFLAIGYLSNNEKLVSGGLYTLSSLVLSTALSLELKYAIRRQRPYDKYPGYIDNRGGDGGGPSFPSWHTSAAFSTATSLSLYCPKWYVIAPSFLWAVSVGYARMNEGVHYPSDVLGGAIVGAGSAFLTYKLNQWLNKPIDKISKNTLQWIYQ